MSDQVKDIDSRNLKVVKETKKDRIAGLFAELVTKGKVTRDIKLSPALTVTISPLAAGERVAAEAIKIATFDGMPYDVIARFRAINVLSYAITAVNGEDITDDNDARAELYNILNKLPVVVVDRMQEEYNDLVTEQNSIFEDDFDVKEAIEDFSEAPGEE